MVFVALHAHTPLFSFFTAGARMYTRMHTGGICRLSSMLGLRLLLQFMPCIDSSLALGFGFINISDAVCFQFEGLFNFNEPQACVS